MRFVCQFSRCGRGRYDEANQPSARYCLAAWFAMIWTHTTEDEKTSAGEDKPLFTKRHILQRTAITQQRMICV